MDVLGVYIEGPRGISPELKAGTIKHTPLPAEVGGEAVPTSERAILVGVGPVQRRCHTKIERKLCAGRRRQAAVVVARVADHGHAELAQVAGAHGAAGTLLGLLQGRQEYGRQHGDDGGDDQKFDEGKCGLPGVVNQDAISRKIR